jgi:hypothetical protein
LIVGKAWCLGTLQEREARAALLPLPYGHLVLAYLSFSMGARFVLTLLDIQAGICLTSCTKLALDVTDTFVPISDILPKQKHQFIASQGIIGHIKCLRHR